MGLGIKVGGLGTIIGGFGFGDGLDPGGFEPMLGFDGLGLGFDGLGLVLGPPGPNGGFGKGSVGVGPVPGFDGLEPVLGTGGPRGGFGKGIVGVGLEEEEGGGSGMKGGLTQNGGVFWSGQDTEGRES